MRRLAHYLFRSDQFVKAFAAGLRAEFADAASAPLPVYLAALVRELEDGDQTQPASISCGALLPREIRNPLRKFKAPRQRNPALGTAILGSRVAERADK